jgi:hypothetical protein
VLDDVIDPEEADFIIGPEQEAVAPEPASDQANLDDIFHDQLEHLMENVEEKLAAELDALVNILKDTIKDSIMTEIKSQLESGLRRPGAAKKDTDQ